MSGSLRTKFILSSDAIAYRRAGHVRARGLVGEQCGGERNVGVETGAPRPAREAWGASSSYGIDK